MRRRPLLTIVGVVALLVVALVGVRILTSPEVERYEIAGDASIAGFPADGNTVQAIERFGPPSRRQDYGRGHCDFQWRSLGITITFVIEPVQQDPCGPDAWHDSTTVIDPRWTTDDGLRVGDVQARMRELYPEAFIDAQGIAILLTRESAAGLELPSLTARVRNRRVASLTVYGPRRAY
jgi:hypothetical protein